MKYLLSILLFANLALAGNSYHVTTTGGGVGQNGSSGQPWRFTYATDKDSSGVAAGDTIWVHAGLHYNSPYNGAWIVDLDGTSGNPIIIRNYANDRVTIEADTPAVGVDPGFVLDLTGANYVWLWGVEVCSRPTGGSRTDPTKFNECVRLNNAESQKLINCYIHDGIQGVTNWSGATRSEMYGNIVANCGQWNTGTGGAGHNIYMQNQYSGKYVTSNILFNSFNMLIQAYGSEVAYMDSCRFERNIFINAVNAPGECKFFVGTLHKIDGDSTSSDTLRHNYMYIQPNDASYSPYVQLAMGYQNHTAHNVVDSNWLVGSQYGSTIYTYDTCDNKIQYNQIWGGIEIVDHVGSRSGNSEYSNNTFRTSTPTSGDTSFILQNKYDATRSTIMVYNWDSGDTVSVAVTGIYSDGTSVKVYNALNLYADTPHTATVASGVLKIPMAAARWTMAQPVDWGTTLTKTNPKAGAFVTTSGSIDQTYTPGAELNPPDPPTATAATGVTNSSFSANWDAATGDPTGYYLDVSTDTFSTFVSGFNNLDVGLVTTKSVTGLSASTLYQYRVRSYNADGTSASSNTISVTTSNPVIKKLKRRK